MLLARDTMQEWTGQYVGKHEWEARHPQDFVRGRRDDQSVPDPRPEPPEAWSGPDGGPFFHVVPDGNDSACMWFYDQPDGDFVVYAGNGAPAL